MSILQQQNIRVEIVVVGSLSELVPLKEAPPKGNGRSLPGGTNNLLASSDLASASYSKYIHLLIYLNNKR